MSVLLYPDEFDNESIESFWTLVSGGGTPGGGVIVEQPTGNLKTTIRRNETANWNSGSTGDDGTQVYQDVAYDQEFDVVISSFVESDFYTQLSDTADINFGLFFKREDDVGNESDTEFFRIMTRGNGNWITNYQHQGQAFANLATTAHSDVEDFWFRLTRSGTGGPMTMRAYYKTTATGTWIPHGSATSSQYRFAGHVGFGGTADADNSILHAYTRYFRNYPASYKLAGTISHDGYLSIIPNETSLVDWGDTPATYPLSVSGTWEIFTSFSGVVSVVGRRASDDKVVGVGGLTPVLVP